MYCRKCGKRLPRNVNRCPECGTDVIEVKQIPYAQKYEEEKMREKGMKKAEPKDYPKEAGYKENGYLNYAVILSVGAFLFALIPWPKTWNIGTSLWMRLLVLVFALMAIYNCVKANQISNYNKTQITKYNARHPKDQLYYAKPKALTLANALAVVTALAATFSLFMG